MFHSPFHLSEVSELYLSTALRTIALSLTGIFIPIYIASATSLEYAIMFFIMFSATHALFIIVDNWIASNYGPKHLIAGSAVVTVIFYWLLSSHYFTAAAIVGGMANSMFWFGYHVDFARNMKSGRQVGIMKAIAISLSAISPVIGGILIYLTGYNSIFLISSLLLFFSFMPLAVSADRPEQHGPDLPELLSADSIPFAGHGAETLLNSILWPLFIYSLFSSAVVLGAITTASLLLSSLLLVAIPVKKQESAFHGYIIANFLAWLAKLATKSLFPLAVLDGMQWIVKNMLFMDFDEGTYEKAKKKGIMSIIMRREITIQLSKIGLMLVFLVVKSIPALIMVSAPFTLLYIA